ncbi:MAG: adenosylmethionine decarboxylase [Anaerolineae bacterium]|nr:adenosylmethionine decarboxylase [Anaerolineae bacterium]
MNIQPTSSAHAIGQQYLIRHIILEATECPFDVLNDLEQTEKLLADIADTIHTEVFKQISHQFDPYGITAMVIVGASHLSVHTWPEYGFATVDLVVCTDNFATTDVMELVKSSLGASAVSQIEFRRGLMK